MDDFTPIDLYDIDAEIREEKAREAAAQAAAQEESAPDSTPEPECAPEPTVEPIQEEAPCTQESEACEPCECEPCECAACECEAEPEPIPTCDDHSDRLAEQIAQAAKQAQEAQEAQAAQVALQLEKLEALAQAQEQMIARIESLDSLFNARIMHTDHEEKIVSQMHKELQKYKEDMYAQLVRPILLDVIAVRDSIMRMAATYLAKPEGEQNIPNQTFADYAYDLQDILEKNNVEIYRSKTGEDYTPIRQRVIKKVPTQEEALHGKIAESLSCGYSYNQKVISAEKITVYIYEKPVQEN